jgi:hypothetical protein
MTAIPKVAGLNCPNCGAAIELRSFTNALSVVCQNCLSVLDARDPNLKILQQAQSKQRIVPDIPLGLRGTFAEGTFEAIGFQERTTYEEGVAYSWFEYLLFNPYKGFRYLTVFRGHWNYVRTLNTLPVAAGSNVVVSGTPFKLYSNSMAQTTFVLGEFPWQVMVGEQVQVTDYVAPPKVLSAETTPEEIVWSMGDYMAGADVWKAFGLTTPVPVASGAFENQPSPFGDKVGSIWRTALVMAAVALLIAFLLYSFGSRKLVYQHSFPLGEAASASFEVSGHQSNLELKTINRTGQPLYVQYSLTKQGVQKPIVFGRQVSSDSQGDVATIPAVDAGHYTLSADPDAPTSFARGVFEVQLRRDVPSLGWLFPALIFIFLPPIMQSMRAAGFERERWAGSDS